jgi:hypothetical protein
MNEMIYALATINLSIFSQSTKTTNLLKLLRYQGCHQLHYFTLPKADVHSVREKEKGSRIFPAP